MTRLTVRVTQINVACGHHRLISDSVFILFIEEKKKKGARYNAGFYELTPVSEI